MNVAAGGSRADLRDAIAAHQITGYSVRGLRCACGLVALTATEYHEHLTTAVLSVVAPYLDQRDAALALADEADWLDAHETHPAGINPNDLRRALGVVPPVQGANNSANNSDAFEPTEPRGYYCVWCEGVANECEHAPPNPAPTTGDQR